MDDHRMPDPEEFPVCRDVNSAEETATLGARAADLLRGGEIVLLYGPLGAGKTCFVQGLCRRLEVTDEVVSPTFTLVNTYTGRLKVHHLDFYRVKVGDDLTDIGVPDILDEVWAGEAVLLVEWPGPLLLELGPDDARLELLAGPAENGAADPDRRTWRLRGVPEAPAAWREIFAGKEGDPC